MSDDTAMSETGAHRTEDEATGSGLTDLAPGDTSAGGGQGGSGASGNALESQPDSAREKIQQRHEDEPDGA